jgi:hypothetical protein
MTALLDQMEATVRDLLDWQSRVRRQPWLYAGVALAAGFVLAGGPGRGIKHTYYRVRPSALRKKLENRYMGQLRQTLDSTIAGLPPGVADLAKDLRFEINATDPAARSDGTIVIEHRPAGLDAALTRAAEVAASVAAAMLTRRLIDELDPNAAAKR